MTERDETNAAFILVLGFLGSFILAVLIISSLEAWGSHNCRERLRELGVKEPKSWPNCRNFDGQRIMQEHYK